MAEDAEPLDLEDLLAGHQEGEIDDETFRQGLARLRTPHTPLGWLELIGRICALVALTIGMARTDLGILPLILLAVGAVLLALVGYSANTRNRATCWLAVGIMIGWLPAEILSHADSWAGSGMILVTLVTAACPNRWLMPICLLPIIEVSQRLLPENSLLPFFACTILAMAFEVRWGSQKLLARLARMPLLAAWVFCLGNPFEYSPVMILLLALGLNGWAIYFWFRARDRWPVALIIGFVLATGPYSFARISDLFVSLSDPHVYWLFVTIVVVSPFTLWILTRVFRQPRKLAHQAISLDEHLLMLGCIFPLYQALWLRNEIGQNSGLYISIGVLIMSILARFFPRNRGPWLLTATFVVYTLPPPTDVVGLELPSWHLLVALAALTAALFVRDPLLGSFAATSFWLLVEYHIHGGPEVFLWAGRPTIQIIPWAGPVLLMALLRWRPFQHLALGAAGLLCVHLASGSVFLWPLAIGLTLLGLWRLPLMVLPGLIMFGAACVHTPGPALIIFGLILAMLVVGLTYRPRRPAT